MSEMSRTFFSSLHRLWISLGGTPFGQPADAPLQESPIESPPAPAEDAVALVDGLNRSAQHRDFQCSGVPAQLIPRSDPRLLLTDRLYLDVPYAEKGDAKLLGARWDRIAKKWYLPAGEDPRRLVKWVPLGTELPGGAPRLSIELVPSTCWYSNVRSNVTPARWKALKSTTARAARHRCEICGGCGDRWPVECHEIWHYDDVRHIQRLEGLIALCPNCHRAKHIGKAEIDGFFEEVLDHICIVNDWTFDKASDYIDECFEQWARRSKSKWTLDISWLERYDALSLPLPSRQ